MAWCFQDKTNKYREAILESLEISNAVVPFLWKLEVSNVLFINGSK